MYGFMQGTLIEEKSQLGTYYHKLEIVSNLICTNGAETAETSGV